MHQEDDEGVEWLDETGNEPGEPGDCGKRSKLEIMSEKRA